jgi:hypothetical protein
MSERLLFPVADDTAGDVRALRGIRIPAVTRREPVHQLFGAGLADFGGELLDRFSKDLLEIRSTCSVVMVVVAHIVCSLLLPLAE